MPSSAEDAIIVCADDHTGAIRVYRAWLLLVCLRTPANMFTPSYDTGNSTYTLNEDEALLFKARSSRRESNMSAAAAATENTRSRAGSVASLGGATPNGV